MSCICQVLEIPSHSCLEDRPEQFLLLLQQYLICIQEKDPRPLNLLAIVFSLRVCKFLCSLYLPGLGAQFIGMSCSEALVKHSVWETGPAWTRLVPRGGWQTVWEIGIVVGIVSCRGQESIETMQHRTISKVCKL